MTSLLRLGLGLCGLLGAVVSLRADSLDDTIVALMRKRHIPGLSLAVVEDGKIVKAKGYGVITAGETAPVTTDTLFQAGSVSKPVAALGALRLVEAKKLSLDTDVNTALQSWKVAENEFTATEKVTLRRLLSHTAGLTVHGFLGYATAAAVPTTLQVLKGEKPSNSPAILPDVEPGSRFRYSGGGYVVMQLLVTEATAQPFPTVMHDLVLKPLGMNASSFEQPLPAALAAKTATAHTGRGKPVPGRWHIYPEMAPAGLWTTASDLARFAISLQQALAAKPDAVISTETARLMVTPILSGYGLGLTVSGRGPTERFGHNGRNTGFDTQLVAYRETGQAAVVMINTNDDSNFGSRVMSAIAEQYGWRDCPLYKTPTPIEDTQPEFTAKIRTIVEQAQEGKFDRSLYTTQMADVLGRHFRDPEVVRELHDYGAIKAVTLVGSRANATTMVYRYLVQFENELTVLTCTYNDSGKIAGMNLQPE